MTRGDIVNITGYEIMAVINYSSADAAAFVVHNNSTHVLVFAVSASIIDGYFSRDIDEGCFIAAYKYFEEDDDINIAYGLALAQAVGIAIGKESDV